MRILNRRVFLGAGITAGVVAGGSIATCNWADNPQTALMLERLEVLKTHIVKADRIGFAARNNVGLAALKHSAEANLELVTATQISCPTERLSHLRRLIQNDFSSGDVLICDRLIISRLEYITAGLIAFG